MKKHFIFLYIFCFHALGFAQTNKNRNPPKGGTKKIESVWHQKKPILEFGLNVSNTLIQFLNSNGSVNPDDPYQLSIKAGGRLMVRTGIGGKYIKREDSFISGDKFQLGEKILGVRAGLEWRIPVAKNFTAYFGADYIWHMAREESVFRSIFFEQTILKNETNRRGWGPVAGFMYHINKRFSLGTELSLYWIYGNGFREEPVPGTAEVNRINWKENGIIPTLPNALYVIVKL